MKRTLTSLVLVCVVAAVAGWVAAQTRNLYREHQAAVEAEQSRLAAEAAAKKLASKIADLARAADDVEVSWFGDAAGKEKREIQLSDPTWQDRFAGILANTTFTRGAHLLAVSDPTITFYRNKADVLFLMPGLGTLVVHGERGFAEFRMTQPASTAILALVGEKDSGVDRRANLPSAAIKPANRP